MAFSIPWIFKFEDFDPVAIKMCFRSLWCWHYLRHLLHYFPPWEWVANKSGITMKCNDIWIIITIFHLLWERIGKGFFKANQVGPLYVDCLWITYAFVFVTFVWINYFCCLKKNFLWFASTQSTCSPKWQWVYYCDTPSFGAAFCCRRWASSSCPYYNQIKCCFTAQSLLVLNYN